jgi:hypothetical protein
VEYLEGLTKNSAVDGMFNHGVPPPYAFPNFPFTLFLDTLHPFSESKSKATDGIYMGHSFLEVPTLGGSGSPFAKITT